VVAFVTATAVVAVACKDEATTTAVDATGATATDVEAGCHMPSSAAMGEDVDGCVRRKREMRREDGRSIMIVLL
jgi:hypothetical protein